MSLFKQFSNYASYPISHQVLLSLLKEYKRPNDKIHDLLTKKEIISLKKGLYVTGPLIEGGQQSIELIANHLMGPSYISLDYALSFYGLIPEKVFEVSSVTVKASKKFKTPLGIFTYTHLPLPYYSFGLGQLVISSNQYAVMASAEKAVCDKIICTKNVRLRSKQEAYHFLIDDLRIDVGALKKLDIALIKKWLPQAPKKNSIYFLIKAISTL
ncbi:MAG: hypothetical protein A3K10_05070 [Bacteroidetes bacterium RIFCSPLOWO2_12_FULL_31_6]|nr:MAG: hypothetical protein A3K10_05070 [Bacteroidetes bacterium RIFCSPLOWO2_12_FULL_31_6]